MAIPICTIKGKFTTAAGEPIPGVVVTAALGGLVVLPSSIVISSVSATSDANGDVEFDLWVNSGYQPLTGYSIAITHGSSRYCRNNIFVTREGEMTLEELLGGGPSPISGIQWAGGISWYPNINWK